MQGSKATHSRMAALGSSSAVIIHLVIRTGVTYFQQQEGNRRRLEDGFPAFFIIISMKIEYLNSGVFNPV